MNKTHKILILHGWTYTTDKWEPFLHALKHEGFTCELLKIPGLTAPLPTVFTLDDYVSWLETYVSKEKNKVVIIGHSNGGRIALAYAHANSDKVEKLILIDSAGIRHNDLFISFKRAVFKTLAKMGKSISKSARLRSFLYKAAREHDYEHADPLVKQTMHNLITVDLTDILAHISVPTMLVWGENDRITPLKDGLIMEKNIPGAKLYTIKDASHCPHYTKPEVVAELIIEELI